MEINRLVVKFFEVFFYGPERLTLSPEKVRTLLATLPAISFGSIPAWFRFCIKMIGLEIFMSIYHYKETLG